ncbi:imidazole glycerol phosphate synthase subunit HisH [Algihabitans albus]|uniref:imidazole glycerol phosphate synthase subunit HisH n=1 Tax=Algihabitans albus TaxID=2164067 RepID=UPI000E5D357C|nr:imidazole glycerol phosphate synthase subunit HisH [Algihabitans albus]
MIAVIDSGLSNIGSVLTALRRIGAEAKPTRDPTEVAAAGSLLLPGVGAFGDGMAALRKHGLVEPIRAHAEGGKPVLGICLGMQLLAGESEEFGMHEGLGLIPGRVRRLRPQAGQRVPNIGWCNLQVRTGAQLFADTPADACFYFVHSYVIDCAVEEDAAGTLTFGDDRATVAIERGRIFGAQFHPEKSQDAGLAVLDAFRRIGEALQ